MSEEEWRDKIAKAVHAAEEQARRARATSRCNVLGRRKVLKMSPTDSPRTLEPRRNLRPHIACGNRELRMRELAALRGFRLAHREARLRFQGGENRVEFPSGTYWMLRFRAHFVLEARSKAA